VPDLYEEFVREPVTLASVAGCAGGDHVGVVLTSTASDRDEVVLDRGLGAAVETAWHAARVARLVEHALAPLALGSGRTAGAGEAFGLALALGPAMGGTMTLVTDPATLETGELHRHQRDRLVTEQSQRTAFGIAIPLATGCIVTTTVGRKIMRRPQISANAA
jgi:hypothetical protein